jgi:desulfoferrodoxin-like iron-binding protein
MVRWLVVASRCSRNSDQEAARMPNQLGKRFQCEACGTEVLCIKAGDGQAECCGKPMELMQPKVLPSAD